MAAPSLRVVTLAGNCLKLLNPQELVVAQILCVDTAYEAASEILVAPTAALVIDLCLLGQEQLGLLGVAREMGTEILAIGSIPTGLSAEDLSGVRLTAKSDLSSALDSLDKANPCRRTPPLAPTPTYDDTKTHELGPDHGKAGSLPHPLERGTAEGPENYAQPQVNTRTSQVLTPAELAALLGDQP